MKKVLFALCFVAIAAVGAIAQEEATVTSSFSTQIYTGFSYYMGSSTIVAGDSDNLDDATSRLNFTGVFTMGDFGAKFTLRAQNIDNDNWQPSYDSAMDTKLSVNGTVGARRAFVFYTFLEQKMYLAAGLPGIGDFSTTYDGLVAFDNALPGVLATVKPIEGLELGYFFPISSAEADAETLFNASTVAAMYEIPSIATVQVWLHQFDDLQVVGDINVTAVEGLTLSGEFGYNDTVDFEDPDCIDVKEQVGYAFGKVSPLVVSSQHFPDSGDMTFTVKPSIAYALSDNIELAAEYAYDSGAENHVFDAYAKFTLQNNYIKVKPGYDTADGKGFFLKTVLVAEF